jgi:hypothetical protein
MKNKLAEIKKLLAYSNECVSNIFELEQRIYIEKCFVDLFNSNGSLQLADVHQQRIYSKDRLIDKLFSKLADCNNKLATILN